MPSITIKGRDVPIQLWAPIEDGNAYKKPYLVEYDTGSLNPGATHALSSTLLTKGVPWVAVDKPRGALYVAEWASNKITRISLDGTIQDAATKLRETIRVEAARRLGCEAAAIEIVEGTKAVGPGLCSYSGRTMHSVQ